MELPFDIPAEISDAARLISVYFQKQGVVKWELMDICSRNHADQNRVYQRFFEFKKQNDAPPLCALTEQSEEILDACEQCGENTWDGRICHSCGMKHI